MFIFLPILNFLAIKIHPVNIKINTIAKAIAPNFESKLFSDNVEEGKFIFSMIIFLSSEDKLIMPSIVLVKKLTLAGS
jgi:hypothetical protein